MPNLETINSNPREFTEQAHSKKYLSYQLLCKLYYFEKTKKTAKFHPFLENRIRIVCGSGSVHQVQVIICRPLAWPPPETDDQQSSPNSCPEPNYTALDEFKSVLWGSLNVLCPNSTIMKWMNQTWVLPIPIALSENGIPDKMFPKFISSELVGAKLKTKKPFGMFIVKIIPFDKTFHICCIQQ